jgi:hypothetical protein
MKRILVSSTLILLLSACAAQPRWRWEKPGGAGTDATRQQDYAQCDYEASAATASLGSGGYRTIVGSSMEKALRENELIQKCMQARGWYKQQF